MKKFLSLVFVAVMFAFVACGPGAKEKAEKETQDSIHKADSLAKVQEVEKAKADSVAKVEADAKAKEEEAKKADSIEKASKKGGKPTKTVAKPAVKAGQGKG